MKKFLCYIMILILIALIALPPLLRVFYTEKGVVIKEKFELMMCTKGDYQISSSYKNGMPLNIEFRYLLNDPNMDVFSEDYALEYNLNTLLKDVHYATREELMEDDKQIMRYFLIYDNVPNDFILDLDSYRQNIELQKQEYTNNGYTCMIIE